jgi:ketosteroid isomerase-like protein
VAAETLERVRRAYELANEGDFSELLGLFGADTEWRGIERGFLWWRNAPS